MRQNQTPIHFRLEPVADVMILIAGELVNCDDVASPHRVLGGHKASLARKPLSVWDSLGDDSPGPR